MAREFGGRVTFLFVYGREMHPTAALPQTGGWGERAGRARRLRDALRPGWRALVDGDGAGSVGRRYGGRANHLVVVGADGRVALKQQAASPSALAAFLRGHLAAGAARAS